MNKVTKLDFLANRIAKGSMPGNAKYIFSKDDWETYRKEVKILFRDIVAKTRPVFLTKPDNMPGGKDLMAEKAIKVRDQLRREIIQEIDEL